MLASGTYTASSVTRVSVTIGTWPMNGTWTYSPPPAPTTGCWVMTSAGVNTGKPCAINLAESRFEPFTDGALLGQRTANIYLRFTVGAPASGEYIRFTADLRTIPGLPAGWSTWTSPTRGFALGN